MKYGRIILPALHANRGIALTAPLDEMVVRIRGQRMYMWRAVDSEGDVLGMLLQKRRNKDAALKLLRKLLKHQGFVPGPTPQSIIPSIFNATSSPAKPSERSERQPSPSGTLRPPKSHKLSVRRLIATCSD